MALWTMQHGKCCYSEMKLPEDGHGKAVEHFHPKSLFGWQRNEWTNLLLICPHCNGRKSNRFPVLLTDDEDQVNVVYLDKASDHPAAIIDPSVLDPEEHLTYVLDDKDDALYGQIVQRNDSIVGSETIEATGIAESFFLRERRAYLRTVLVQRWHDLLAAIDDGDEEARDTAIEAFQRLVRGSAKFAGMAREFARERKMDERYGIEIPGREG